MWDRSGHGRCGTGVGMEALFGCGCEHSRMWDGSRYGGYNLGVGMTGAYHGLQYSRETCLSLTWLVQFLPTWSRWPLVIQVGETLMSWKIKTVTKSAYCRPIDPTHPQVTKPQGRHVLKSVEVAANPKVLEPCLQTPVYLPGTVLYVVSLCKQAFF